MATVKYKDPATGEVMTVGLPTIPKPRYDEITMLASNWVDNTYSFEDTYPHSAYDIEIGIGFTATEEQYDAFCEAKIKDCVTENVATIAGVVPTIDIPITVKVVAK